MLKGKKLYCYMKKKLRFVKKICIVKRKANKISLKKKDNIYFSKTEAPDGWRESLEFVIRMESKNF